jgi:actin-related protein
LLAGESSIVRALKDNNDRLNQENARLLEIQQQEEADERLQQERAERLQQENEVKGAENTRLKNDRAADSSMNHTVKVYTIWFLLYCQLHQPPSTT